MRAFRTLIVAVCVGVLGVVLAHDLVDDLAHNLAHDLAYDGGRLQAQTLADVLSAADVSAVLTAAATATADSTLAVAVVDRTGQILGVYARPGADVRVQDVAVSLARTGAFFSNDAAPLSSRTVRFISGIHFPPGIPNTGNAALYGIENTNRGCSAGTQDAVLTVLPRPRGIQGTAGAAGLFAPPLPCDAGDTRGCTRGDSIADDSGPVASGITTGKASLRDTEDFESSVNPGGTPLYRNGQVIGGIGVSGVSRDRADFAAIRGAAAAGRGITPVGTFPNELPLPRAVFIDGIRLPFFRGCRTVACVNDTATNDRPTGSVAGAFSQFDMRGTPSGGRPAPEGYILPPRGGSGGLTAADVARIVEGGIAVAQTTRAAIRLPSGQSTRMVMTVSDANGEFLAIYRMPDATMFSVDVSMEKARNAYYFSSPEGYRVLKDYADRSRYTWEPAPPPGRGWALTNRTLSFGGQPLFPPGIDLEKSPTPGPWFELFRYDSQNPCTEGPGPSRGGNRSFLNQSGIVWFPGSVPLYKGGNLVGGLGVSGDGVEQDDFVTAGAAAGFEPPTELRVDNSTIGTEDGAAVRLPYLKFPRNPTAR